MTGSTSTWTCRICSTGIVLFLSTFGPRSLPVACSDESLDGTPRIAGARGVVIPEDWQFEPAWREKGDCGPLALFVLMKLEGNDITVGQIKAEVPVDPIVGSTLESLHAASSRLGLDTEMRFVSPRNIRKVQPPFIMHGVTSVEQNFGHYVVVVGFDSAKDTIKMVDPEREWFTENPTEGVLAQATGYILVPEHASARRWDYVSGVSLIVCGLAIIWIFGSAVKPAQRRVPGNVQ